MTFALLLRQWKLVLGGVVALGLLIALAAARIDARHWHKQSDAYKAQLTLIQAQAARDTAAAALKAQQAADAYNARAAALQPIVVHSRDTVVKYAQTPAGRATCLSAERLRGIDALDTSLRDPTAPTSGASPLPPNPGASPSGR